MIHIAKPVIGEEEKNAVLEVLSSGMLAQGSKVKELEQKFAEYCGTKYAIAFNNGTSALHACNNAIGIKPGDEVITVPFTFVATANSIIMQGAKPVFVDIKKNTFNMDPEKIEEKITEKTRAILVVDLYGQIHDYEAIKAIANKHNLKIIEDACQAVGAELNGRKAGNFGDVAAFSLYATKNMTSGEGGIVVTNDEEIDELCRRFRHHGQSEKTRYQYFELGFNYRMMDLQAAIALEQLKKIESFNTKRIKHAKSLIEALSGTEGLTLPFIKPYTKHVFHQFTMIVEDNFKYTRDELMEKLKQKGIGCAVFYPKPLHLHPHFSRMGYKEGDFPVSEKLAKKVISLPVHPSLNQDDMNKIIKAFEEIQNE